MAFLTPCFARVEDAAERKKLIEWLEEIGQEFCIECNELVFSNKYSGLPFNCGTNVDLFRALAAMNDENDREQWFVVNNVAKEMILANSDAAFDFIFSFPYSRKATTEEIISYFKNKENE